MAHYTAEIKWQRGNQDFIGNQYSRKHTVRFDGGIEMPASSSPHVVPLPMSDAAAVDPEEMFVSSLASCHMLWFLSIAAKHQFCVDLYSDNARGVMGKNEHGRIAMTLVTLTPEVTFSGAHLPTFEQIEQMHHEAHEECFIANSVTAKIICKPVNTL